MKNFTKTLIRRLLPILLCATGLELLSIHKAAAQVPDCLSNTFMYGVFSPKNSTAPTPGFDSTEIRPIAFVNGAVGGLMGGRRYRIVKNIGGSNFFGSSAMGLSPVTGRFYLITQMGTGSSNSGDKDIVMINPLAPTATGTVIGTIGNVPDGAGGPTSMKDYHFVKAAIAPNGFGYAVGVHRQSGATASTFNPIVRFNVCNTAGCSTPILLGYIQSGGITDRMNLFNGDIAFDNSGNMYFFASAFFNVNGTNKYTDARLFRINAANIPGAAGTGTIPMNFVADFDGIDSTGASGLVLDLNGNMYLTLRSYTDNNPANPYVTQLYSSFDSSTTNLMTGFGPVHDSLSAGDLAACYFPGAILTKNNISLTTRYQAGNSNLKWEVSHNEEINYFEIQASQNGADFETISKVYPNSSQFAATYYYTDHVNSSNSGQRYYRVRVIMKTGIARFYSNVTRITINLKLNLVEKPAPNPFNDRVGLLVELKSAQKVDVKILDQNGRIVVTKNFNGITGENKFTVEGLARLTKGIYIVEIKVEDETVREKLVRQ